MGPLFSAIRKARCGSLRRIIPLTPSGESYGLCRTETWFAEITRPLATLRVLSLSHNKKAALTRPNPTRERYDRNGAVADGQSSGEVGGWSRD